MGYGPPAYSSEVSITLRQFWLADDSNACATTQLFSLHPSKKGYLVRHVTHATPGGVHRDSMNITNMFSRCQQQQCLEGQMFFGRPLPKSPQLDIEKRGVHSSNTCHLQSYRDPADLAVALWMVFITFWGNPDVSTLYSSQVRTIVLGALGTGETLFPLPLSTAPNYRQTVLKQCRKLTLDKILLKSISMAKIPDTV